MTTVIDPPVAAQPSLQPTSRGQRARIVLVLGSLIALGPLTIDMYLPALPVITEDLHSGPTATQLTLTGTLAGLAFGQLVLGPLSDAVGRRRPLLAGLALHVVASLLCAVAPHDRRTRSAPGVAGLRGRRRHGRGHGGPA